MPETTSETSGTFHDPRELVRRRWLKGLNQSELAELAGISPGTLSKLETGRHLRRSTAHTLGRVAEALGCTIEDLERKPASVAS